MKAADGTAQLLQIVRMVYLCDRPQIAEDKMCGKPGAPAILLDVRIERSYRKDIQCPGRQHH